MVTYLVECLPKPHPIVSSVKLSETQQRVLLCPIPNRALLDPMPGDSKVAICVGSLPCVARQAYLTAHGSTLTSRS